MRPNDLQLANHYKLPIYKTHGKHNQLQFEYQPL